MVVHARWREPSYGRRFVIGLLHGTDDGRMVCAMKHAMVLDSTMAPSMTPSVVHHGGRHDFSHGAHPWNMLWAPVARATE